MFIEIVSLVVAVSGTVAHPGGDCFANRYTGDTYAVGNEWFCGVVPSDGVTVKSADNKVIAPASPVITIETTQEIVEVVNPTPTPKPAPIVTDEKKPKCNNGEGNGSEGCSPANSDNANNDENNTTPKDDKSHK